MRSLIAVPGCIFLFMGSVVSATTLGDPLNVYLDFGTAALPTQNPDVYGHYWNNVVNYAQGATLNLVDDANTPTDVNIVLVSASYATNTGALTNPDPNLLGDLAIGTATGDYFMHIKPNAVPVFQLTGLDPNSRYVLSFYAGRNHTEERITQFDVQGANAYVGTLSVAGTGIGSDPNDPNHFPNGNDHMILASDLIVPDSNGVIQVTFSALTSTYGYLAAMRVEEVTGTMYLDFGTAALTTQNPDVYGHYWNNVVNYAQGATLNLVDDANTPTDVNIVFVSASYATNTGALTNPDPNLLGDLAIGTATGDYFMHIKPNAVPVFQLTGLDPNSRYVLSFYAGRNHTEERITQFDVQGANAYVGPLPVAGTGIGSDPNDPDHFPNGNDHTILVSDPIVPDATGVIQVTFSALTSTYGYLSAMKVVAF